MSIAALGGCEPGGQPGGPTNGMSLAGTMAQYGWHHSNPIIFFFVLVLIDSGHLFCEPIDSQFQVQQSARTRSQVTNMILGTAERLSKSQIDKNESHRTAGKQWRPNDLAQAQAGHPKNF